MPCCEKCWGDAYMRSMIDGRAQAEHYRELIEERKDSPCTTEEQEGKNDLPLSGL